MSPAQGVFGSTARFLSRNFAIAKAHPFIAAATVTALAGGGYWGYTNYVADTGETIYVLAAAARGELVVSVSGTGQVSAKNQIELSTEVSGDVVSIPGRNGADVRIGALIVQIDSRDAEKAVRDAEVNLESARLALQKLKKPAEALALTQSEHALAQSKTTLAQAYDDGFSAVSNAFLDLPGIMTGLDEILYDNDASPNQDNIAYFTDAVKSDDPTVLSLRDDVERTYRDARTAYELAFATYKATSRFAETATVEALVRSSYEATKSVSEATKSVSDLLNFVKDSLEKRNLPVSAVLTSALAILSTSIGETNGHLTALLSIKDTIVESKQDIAENTQALDDLKAGTDELDIAAQELVVRQRENALADARENLADYFVRAPFDGRIAKINVDRATRVSAGSSVVTFITDELTAEISLNEIDASNVAPGQKAALTFDAVEGLAIEGTVVEIDTVGSVSSGVVTYTVTIGFEGDERIKPGMTVNAEIVTERKEGALIVPASAVKSDRGGSYVEVVPEARVDGRETRVSGVTPVRVEVEVGLSNDTHTEIIAGLAEGAAVVVRTIADSTEANSQQAPTFFQAAGMRPPGGGPGGGPPGSGAGETRSGSGTNNNTRNQR